MTNPTTLSPEVLEHVQHDQVAWLTTVTDSGAPAPVPVWFVDADGDLVVFSEPGARKVANIQQRPLVTLHFNSDPDGVDVVVVRARAVIEPDNLPSRQPGYIDKYQAAMAHLPFTVDDLDRDFSTRIRLTPLHVWSPKPY
jgi:PPOX class probable F420-dependent enzyme